MEAVFAWAADVGRDLDELTPEQRKGILQMVVDEVIVHRNDNVDITLAIPIDSEGHEVLPAPRVDLRKPALDFGPLRSLYQAPQ